MDIIQANLYMECVVADDNGNTKIEMQTGCHLEFFNENEVNEKKEVFEEDVQANYLRVKAADAMD